DSLACDLRRHRDFDPIPAETNLPGRTPILERLRRDRLPLAVVKVWLLGSGLDVVSLVGLTVRAFAVNFDDLDVMIFPLPLDRRRSILGSQVDFLGLGERGRRDRAPGSAQGHGYRHRPHQVVLPGMRRKFRLMQPYLADPFAKVMMTRPSNARKCSS